MMVALNKYFFFLWLFLQAFTLSAQNTTPKLEWLSPTPSGTIDVPIPEVSIEVAIKGVAQLQMEKCALWVDGMKIEQSTPTGTSKFTTVPLQKEAQHIFKATIALHEGEQEVVFAYDNVRLPAKRFRYVSNSEKPNLYVLAMGTATDFDENGACPPNLRYTVKDACDFSNAFRGQGYSTRSLYKNIVIDTLLGRAATLVNMRARVEQLEMHYLYYGKNSIMPDETPVKPNDVICVFISSHGMRYGDRYYLMASDARCNAPRASCIEFDFILDRLSNIPCRKILFIDACQNDPSVARGIKTNVYQLAQKHKNFAVFFSCAPGEASIESSEWANGAFTKLLLEGFSGKADHDKNTQITISEIRDYFFNKMPHLNTDQQPQLIYNDLGYETPIYDVTTFNKDAKPCFFNAPAKAAVGVLATTVNDIPLNDLGDRLVSSLKKKGFNGAVFGMGGNKQFSNLITIKYAKQKIGTEKIMDEPYDKWEALLLVRFMGGKGVCEERLLKTIIQVRPTEGDEKIDKECQSKLIKEFEKLNPLPLCN